MSSFLNVLLAAPLLVLWIVAIVDVSRRSDISTGRKWLRIAGIVLIPYIGVFLYLVWRPDIGIAESETATAPTGLVADIEMLLDRTPAPDDTSEEVRRLIQAATAERPA
ncbi:MAG: PLD nuclease N-terminal domain-containing protein [Acidimicrobiales bacterium]